MRSKQFDKQAKGLFGEVISEFGFSPEGSKRATFWRKIPDDIYHIIMPSLNKGGIDFSVFVFPTSPIVQPRFEDKFPDDLGVVTHSFLNEKTGIGPNATNFWCKYPDILDRQFEKRVRRLLIDKAIPYLDRFFSLASMVSDIRNPFALALALDHLGNRTGARKALEPELKRLALMDKSNPDLAAIIDLAEKLIPGRL